MAGNKTTIFFDKKLYSRNAIRRAAEAFRELADFGIGEVGLSYRVFVQGRDKEVGMQLADEFSNYVLAEMKNE